MEYLDKILSFAAEHPVLATVALWALARARPLMLVYSHRETKVGKRKALTGPNVKAP